VRLFSRAKAASSNAKTDGNPTVAESTAEPHVPVVVHKKGELFSRDKAVSFTETWSSTAQVFIPVNEEEIGFSREELPPLDGSVCPQCWGVDRRPSGDGGFVCVSSVARSPLADVVPAGMAGNVNAVPIYGNPVWTECGWRYCEEQSKDAARMKRLDISAAAMRAREDRGRHQEIRSSSSPVEQAVRQLALHVAISDIDMEVEGGRRVQRPRTSLARSQVILHHKDCPQWASRQESAQLCDLAIARWFADGAKAAGVAADGVAGRTAWQIPGVLVDPLSFAARPDALIGEDGSLHIDGTLSDAAVLWLASRLGIAVQWDSALLRLP
jgi:hypothetical protein